MAARAIREASELRRGLEQFNGFQLPQDVIPVLIPVYSRPQYLQQVLDSLRKANNIDNTVLVFSQDGANEEISRLITGIDFARVIHLRHSPPYLGIPSWFVRTDMPTAANVFFLLRFAFDYAHVQAAVVLESDIVISPDALDYFKWAYNFVSHSFMWRHRVFTINGYYELSRNDGDAGSAAAGVPAPGADGFAPSTASAGANAIAPVPRDPFTFTTHDYGFMVWGWLCPDFSWPRIRSGWTWFHNWDITLEEYVRKPSGTVSLSPMISRTKNIGMQGINFNVQDPSEIAKWHSLYTPTEPIDYSRATPKIYETAFPQAAGARSAAGVQSAGSSGDAASTAVR